MRAFFFGILFCFVGIGSLFAVELPFKIQSAPIRYMDHAFVFTDRPSFIKLDSDGHVIWELPKNLSEFKTVSIKFGMVVFLSNTGKLECYNEAFGYKVWQHNNEAIQSIYLAYPVFVFQDDQGLGGMDFFSGQVVWHKDHVKVSSYCTDNLSNQMIGVVGDQLVRLDPMTGDMVSLGKMPKGAQHVQEGWDQNLIVYSEQKIWVFNKGSALFQESAIQRTPLSKVIDNHYVINVDPKLRSWKKWDLETQALVWDMSLEASPNRVTTTPSLFLCENALVIIEKNGVVAEYNYGTGARIGTLTWEKPVTPLDVETTGPVVKITTSTKMLDLMIDPDFFSATGNHVTSPNVHSSSEIELRKK